jgi:hypothetical protein
MEHMHTTIEPKNVMFDRLSRKDLAVLLSYLVESLETAERLMDAGLVREAIRRLAK